MRKILILFIGLMVSLSAKDLILEKTLIEGKLENGLKYTIKKNKKPEKTASFRLIVKVGSLEEDEDQRGIAHLLEHLAFNGTKHFKDNSLVDFLESLGVDFGSHLNASTGWERTMYQLQVPLKGDNLEKSMLVFSDWAGGIDITQKELDKERGVVLEEKRVRNTGGYRIFKQVLSTMYKDTRYEKRFPIGKEKVIKNISLKRVKDFYTTWYQPRFMNFVAVGDFDVKKIEKLIKENFSSLKNTSKKDTYSRSAKDFKTTKFKIFKDKEVSKMKVNLSFIEPYKKPKSEEDYKKELVLHIISNLINLKSKELMLEKNPPAKDVRFGNFTIGDNLRYNSFSARFVKKDGLKAFKQMLNFIYGIEKNGFSKSDLEVVKKDIIANNNDELKNIENITSNDWASEIAYYKTNDEIFVDKKYAIKLEERLLKGIGIKDVNNAFRKILQSKNKLVYVKVPNDYSVSKDELKKVFDKRKEGVKSEDNATSLPKDIKIKNLKPADITSQNYNKKYDFYEFTLSNGVKVVYKYNNYEKDKVILNSFSKGGYSLYDTEILPSAKKGAKIINKSGLGKYNSLEIEKIYADKIIEIKPKIDRYYENFSGNSNAKDFKYLLKNIYLLAYMYRLDENVLANSKVQMIEAIEKEKNIPMREFSRQFVKFYYDNNKRYTKLEKDDIKSINKKDILKIYADRFSDFNNFTFFIIGDIKKEKVEKYIKLYLGNLPTKKRDENFKNRGIKHIKGKHEFIKYLNNENISTVMFVYKKILPFSIESNIKIQALEDVLNVKLRELIREEKSGVYGVRIGIYFDREPKDEVSVRIYFSCKPKRRKELAKYVKEVIKSIKTKEVEQKYINSFIKKSIVSLDERAKNNDFYMDELQNHYMYKDDIQNINEYKKLFKTITPKIVKQTANEVFDTNDIVYVEINPKKIKPKGNEK